MLLVRRKADVPGIQWPPGPGLPAAVQTALMATAPVSFLSVCRRRYGDCFSLRAAPWGRSVYLADAHEIARVFHDRDVFEVSEAREPQALVMGRRSLFLLDGDRHVAERRILTPLFHGTRLDSYRQVIEEVARDEMDRWPLGKAFAMRPRLHDITLRAIIRIVVGTAEEECARALHDRLAKLLAINPTLIVAVPAVRRDFGRFSPWGRFVRVRQRTDELLYDQIRRARRGDGADDSVLSQLARARDPDGWALTDDELRDELVTLLVAGEETTASALAWTFERLARHPDVISRLRAAMANDDSDGYLDAVITESLRSRPILAGTTRNLAVDADLAGYHLPAGAIIVISQVLAHLDPTVYPEPERFDPDRFVGASADPSAFVAFGGGARRCLGASLARLEMQTVIRMALERFDVRCVDRRPERRKPHHVTLTPARGAVVVLERRPPAGP